MIGICSVHCLRNADTNKYQEDIIANQRQLDEKLDKNLQEQKEQRKQLERLQLTINTIVQKCEEQRKEQQQVQLKVDKMLGYIQCIKRIFNFIHNNLNFIVHLLMEHLNIHFPN